MKRKKVVVILGPTSSGKTSLAVKLACDLEGEIISADSRQVYRGMDIGTGKDLADFSFKDNEGKETNIAYHLIDVADPSEQYDIVRWNKEARRAIDDVLSKNKLPILVGGTGLYLQSLVDNYDFSAFKPDRKKRESLEEKSIEDLLGIIKKKNPEEFKNIDENDRGNKRRLVRYAEILDRDSKFSLKKSLKKEGEYDFLLLGLNPEKEELDKKIHRRLVERMEEGMVEEVEKLHKEGLGWERLEQFGLEYRFVSRYLQKKISYQDMFEKLFIAIKQFAKRQMTWFRRWEKQGASIYWIENMGEVEMIIRKFLGKK